MTRRLLTALLILAAAAAPAAASHLTPAQLQALKTAINADPALSSQPNNEDGAAAIATALHQLASPAFYVWRAGVSMADVAGAAGWDWARIDNLSVGKARIIDYWITLGAVNPSLSTVRAGVEAAFSVEGADQGMRQAIYDAFARRVTRAEKIFSTGTGAAPTHHGVGPGALGVDLNGQPIEGLLDVDEVITARSL